MAVDYYGVLQALGEYYNQAFIIVENNSHGILTYEIGQRLCLPNMYLETQVDKLTDRETIKLGFTTTSKTNL